MRVESIGNFIVMQQSFVFVPHSILFIGLLNNGQQGVVYVSLSCAI